MFPAFLAALATVSLASASPSQTNAVRALAAQDVRLAGIAWRLARGGDGPANDRLCSGRVSLPGLVVQDAAQYPEAERAAARAALGLGAGPTIVAVVPQSGADRAGFMAGDEILAVGGTAITASVARDAYARVQQLEDLVEAKTATGPVQIDLRRADGVTRLSYSPEPGCASRVQIVPGRSINASADGRYVQITAAMVDFTRNDDELAVVTAHEMAHNILRHKALGTPSKTAEYEADRLGVWLVARGGYDVDAVVPFWTRLGKSTGLGILSDGSHPRWRPRVARVAEAVAAVKAQRAAKQALVPPPVGAPQQSSSQAQ